MIDLLKVIEQKAELYWEKLPDYNEYKHSPDSYNTGYYRCLEDIQDLLGAEEDLNNFFNKSHNCMNCKHELFIKGRSFCKRHDQEIWYMFDPGLPLDKVGCLQFTEKEKNDD